MKFDDKIIKINQVVSDYFKHNTQEQIIAAKDLMSQFIKAGIFNKDYKNGLPIRNVLQDLDRKSQLDNIPFAHPVRKTKNTNWFFVRTSTYIPVVLTNKPNKASKTYNNKQGRKDSDEHYVIDLCDEALNQKASRQHKFDFLLGDLHKNGKTRTKLPVDAYYENLNLVVEFMEKQHTEDVAHFDKPDVMTISGVNRGMQRKIYDQRRQELISQNGIDLVIISYSDFNHSNRKKLLRNKELDLAVVKNIIYRYISDCNKK